VQTFTSGNTPNGNVPGSLELGVPLQAGPDSTAPFDLLMFGDLLGS